MIATVLWTGHNEFHPTCIFEWESWFLTSSRSWTRWCIFEWFYRRWCLCFWFSRKCFISSVRILIKCWLRSWNRFERGSTDFAFTLKDLEILHFFVFKNHKLIHKIKIKKIVPYFSFFFAYSSSSVIWFDTMFAIFSNCYIVITEQKINRVSILMSNPFFSKMRTKSSHSDWPITTDMNIWCWTTVYRLDFSLKFKVMNQDPWRILKKLIQVKMANSIKNDQLDEKWRSRSNEMKILRTHIQSLFDQDLYKNSFSFHLVYFSAL